MSLFARLADMVERLERVRTAARVVSRRCRWQKRVTAASERVTGPTDERLELRSK